MENGLLKKYLVALIVALLNAPEIKNLVTAMIADAVDISIARNKEKDEEKKLLSVAYNID